MPNRLAREASPYLRQHAENPVDWYPWGEEALARARREDKPILLSVGYSACHWCHVMERESFSDAETAATMNERFVCVKVDREERPDVDQIYQLVVQLLGRGGGWPLTVFLTPDQRPFFGGTYFPDRDRHGLPSLRRVLAAISEAYRERKGDVEAQASVLARAVGDVFAATPAGEGALAPGVGARAARRLVPRFDDANGGFGDRPKFPNPTALDALLVAGERERCRRALEAMRAGGIWDHLGGGFHRYSTDERWLVPHFEKMLYDNALLLRAYADGFRVFGDGAFAETARGVVGWLAREMTDAGGAFYASEDADSDGEEGRFFVWSQDEVRAAVGDADAAEEAIRCFGVTAEGSFEATGESVLFAAAAPADAARFERSRAAMLAARERRARPARDEKILAGWNALAIGALADASVALGEPDWLARAERAYAFVRRELTREAPEGLRVRRLAAGGAAKGEGFLDDHAYLAAAALDLHAAGGDPRCLEDARALADAILSRFYDAEGGGFFFAPQDGEALIVRGKDPYDGPTPSGAAVACRVLLALGQLGAGSRISGASYLDVATRELERVSGAAIEEPMAHAHYLGALEKAASGSVDVVVVGPRDDPRTRALARAAGAPYVPARNLVWIDPAAPAALGVAEGKAAPGAPRAYVCRGRTCSAPVTEPEALASLLRT